MSAMPCDRQGARPTRQEVREATCVWNAMPGRHSERVSRGRMDGVSELPCDRSHGWDRLRAMRRWRLALRQAASSHMMPPSRF